MTGSIIIITGPIDIVADSQRGYAVRNGHPMMAQVSGTGCTSGAVAGCFLGAAPNCSLEGHSTGDFVLKFLGKTLQDIFRSDDFICRWGGDEFVVFMRHICDKNTIISRIERLRVKLSQCKKEEYPLPITVSIGGEIATSEMTMKILFDHCDKSLYKVKAQGRNNYFIYSD